MDTLRIAPSLLAADFSRLGTEVASIEGAADSLHLDVMDGHFVPNLTFGMPVISDLRALTDMHFDCHLMTTNPEVYIEDLAEAGANLLTMHIEAVPDPEPAAQRTREAGLDFGLVINPVTPFAAVAPFLELVDLLLVMSVEPGFGGQPFMDEVLPKVSEAREWVESHGLVADIQIDGGIDVDTAPRARAAGANVFVAGTSVFGKADRKEAVARLRAAIEAE